MLKTLKLQKWWKDSDSKNPGVSLKQKTVFRDNHGQNIYGKF